MRPDRPTTLLMVVIYREAYVHLRVSVNPRVPELFPYLGNIYLRLLVGPLPAWKGFD